MLSENHAKTINIAELKIALLSIWNDLPQEFIDKTIHNPVISKETSIMCCCSWWTFLHSLNTERAAELKFVAETLELLTKSCPKLIRYY